MKRPRFLALPVVILAAAPCLAAEVAILKSTDAPSWRPALETLRRRATRHTLSEYDLAGDRAQGERVLVSLRDRNLILVGLGPLAATLCRTLAPQRPLVFAMVADPAREGLANAPNTAGVAFTIPVKNQLAAFRMVNPAAVRVGVIYSQENSRELIAEAVAASRVVRMAIVERPVESARDIPKALRELLGGREAVSALWIPPDPILLAEETRRFLLSETLKAGTPIYSFSRMLVAEGALVSNGPDMGSIGDEIGELLNRLDAGEPIAGIGQLIPRAELVINKKIADQLKIEIPADALRAASEVQ